MKALNSILILILSLTISSCAQNKSLLIDDLEGELSGGAKGTVDFGSGEGSSVEVTAAKDIKYQGEQSLKITYDAISGGYMWIARGFGLDAKNSKWLVENTKIKWNRYNAFSFYIYGSNSKARICIDIKDSQDEMWRFIFTDDFTGWKQIICPFKGFFARSDWQPATADVNGIIDFPIKSYQLEPIAKAKGVLYIDNVELIKTP